MCNVVSRNLKKNLEEIFPLKKVTIEKKHIFDDSKILLVNIIFINKFPISLQKYI